MLDVCHPHRSSHPDPVRDLPPAGAALPNPGRRRFVQILSAGALATWLGDEAFASGDIRVEFHHGVASGDPLADRVVIWTRATSPQASRFLVLWLVATDPQMRQIVASGLAQAEPEFDYTIKVDVTGLRPDTTYYYQFVYRRHRSPVGRTRTLSDGHLEHVRLAFVSCSNYPKGYFNAYAELARMDDVTLVLHLGDYLYEYGQEGYVTLANALLGVPQPRLAALVPPHECVTLADYRARYALYRSDPALQEVHRTKAFICIWDDHETANDAWRDGAENHRPEHGDWRARRDAGIRAYYEWLPIREPADGDRIKAWRSFRLGNLARLMVLETRLSARDEPLDANALARVYAGATADGRFPLDVTAHGTPRELLGTAQTTWLAEELTAAAREQTWQLIGQQVLFFYQPAPDFLHSSLLSAAQKQQLIQGLDQLFGPGAGQAFGQIGARGGPNPAMADAWTGYPSAKRALAELLARVPNPVILSGDSHNAWAVNLKLPTPQGILPLGVEFGGTSVTAPGFEQTLIMLAPEQTAQLIIAASQANPLTDELIYAEMARRGFTVIDITHERMRGEFYFLDTVLTPNYRLTLERVFTVPRGARRIVE